MTEEKRDVFLTTPPRPQGILVNQWDAVIAADHTLKDVMNPAYWAHHATKFQNGDIVSVYTEDESNYGRFIVTGCSRTHVNLHKLEWHQLSTTESATSEEYAYAWKGPTKRHCVIRKSDSVIVQEALPTKEDAIKWIASSAKAA